MKYLENHIQNEISNCSREIVRLQQKGGSSVEKQIIRRRVHNIAQQVEKLTGGDGPARAYASVSALKGKIGELNAQLRTLSGIETNDIITNLQKSKTGIDALLAQGLENIPDASNLDAIREQVAALTKLIVGEEDVGSSTADGDGDGDGEGKDGAGAGNAGSAPATATRSSADSANAANAVVTGGGGRDRDRDRDGEDTPPGQGGGARKNNSTYYKYLKYKMKYMNEKRQ